MSSFLLLNAPYRISTTSCLVCKQILVDEILLLTKTTICNMTHNLGSGSESLLLSLLRPSRPKLLKTATTPSARLGGNLGSIILQSVIGNYLQSFLVICNNLAILGKYCNKK